MTVQKLIEKLQALDKPDMPVVVYCSISEDGDAASNVKIITEEDDFYYKGDSPLSFGKNFQNGAVAIY